MILMDIVPEGGLRDHSALVTSITRTQLLWTEDSSRFLGARLGRTVAGDVKGVGRSMEGGQPPSPEKRFKEFNWQHPPRNF
jgi:hypothetical protein